MDPSFNSLNILPDNQLITYAKFMHFNIYIYCLKSFWNLWPDNDSPTMYYKPIGCMQIHTSNSTLYTDIIQTETVWTTRWKTTFGNKPKHNLLNNNATSH